VEVIFDEAVEQQGHLCSTFNGRFNLLLSQLQRDWPHIQLHDFNKTQPDLHKCKGSKKLRRKEEEKKKEEKKKKKKKKIKRK